VFPLLALVKLNAPELAQHLHPQDKSVAVEHRLEWFKHTLLVNESHVVVQVGLFAKLGAAGAYKDSEVAFNQHFVHVARDLGRTVNRKDFPMNR